MCATRLYAAGGTIDDAARWKAGSRDRERKVLKPASGKVSLHRLDGPKNRPRSELVAARNFISNPTTAKFGRTFKWAPGDQLRASPTPNIQQWFQDTTDEKVLISNEPTASVRMETFY